MLAKYSVALSWVPIAGNAVAKTLEQIGKDLAENPIDKQRANMVELMKQSDKTVVVLIDDLDRLDRDEVMAMLKFVRLSANFPNMLYLLAFDEKRVARVAGEAYGEDNDGHLFLEKVIQYPYSLPVAPKHRLTVFVMERAKAACVAAGIQLSEQDWSDFEELCRSTFLIRLATPRQGLRYANALRFALPMLAGEVDPFNLMVVEAMRILFPDLYDWARNLDQSAGDPVSSTGLSAEAKKALSEEAMKAVSKEERPAVSGILTALMGRTERQIQAVFGNPRYHERYFSYAIPPDQLPDAPIEELLRLAETDAQDAINKATEDIIQTRPTDLFRRLDRRRMTFRQIEHLTLALLAAELASRGGQSYKETDLANSVVWSITNMIANSGRFRASDDFNQLIKKLIETATPKEFKEKLKSDLAQVLSRHFR